MNRVIHCLHEGFGCIFRPILKGLALIMFRPKRTFASEAARQQAFREPMIIISNHVHGMDGAMLQTLMPLAAFTASPPRIWWSAPGSTAGSSATCGPSRWTARTCPSAG